MKLSNFQLSQLRATHHTNINIRIQMLLLNVINARVASEGRRHIKEPEMSIRQPAASAAGGQSHFFVHFLTSNSRVPTFPRLQMASLESLRILALIK